MSGIDQTDIMEELKGYMELWIVQKNDLCN